MTRAEILPVLFLKCHSVVFFHINEVQYKSFYFCFTGRVAWLLNSRRRDLCDGGNMTTTRIKVSVCFLFVMTSLWAKHEQMNRYIRTLHLSQFSILSMIGALISAVI
jgi:hypothetical protein